jgi:MtN3 and saliva related transmembrane protein
MDLAETLGFAAGLLTTAAFVPQVLKIWTSKSAKDISLPAFATFTVGIGIWIAYGIVKDAPPIVLWNAVTMALAIAILAMKVKYR